MVTITWLLFLNMWSSGELLFLKYSRTELKSTGSACLILKSKTGNFLAGRMMQRVEKFHTWPHMTGHPQGISQVLCLKLCSGCVKEMYVKSRWTAHLNLIPTPMTYHPADTNIPQSKVVWNSKHFWVPAFWVRRETWSVVERTVSGHSGSLGGHLPQN